MEDVKHIFDVKHQKGCQCPKRLQFFYLGKPPTDGEHLTMSGNSISFEGLVLNCRGDEIRNMGSAIFLQPMNLFSSMVTVGKKN